MRFDIFFSICQTDVDGYMPDERTMFSNFFDQLHLADNLGFGTAWLAETHLSCELQKAHKFPVIPHFKGEIGLNTDILQMAHKIFGTTKNLNVGSAIRNILCNGGPMAHAEAVRTFLTIHGQDPQESRILDLGFASGRFEFSNRPYGIVPRNAVEEAAWPVMKGKIFLEAVEVFLRLLRGDTISSEDTQNLALTVKDFRTEDDWQRVLDAHGSKVDSIPIAKRWNFERTQIIPKETKLDNLRLTIGSHDPVSQDFANTILPCGVFNLSITPSAQIEKTHERMQGTFHKDGGQWTRQHMPRTVLIFPNDDADASEEEKNQRAEKAAQAAIANYWKAMAGTIDQEKVDNAVENALAGSPNKIIAQLKNDFHPDERLMLWFDFNNHNNEEVMRGMRIFMDQVAPEFRGE